MAWTKEEQIGCYGTTEEIMESNFLRDGNTGKYSSDRTMYAMGLLSDAQEILKMDRKYVYGHWGVEPNELVRWLLNRAKYFIGDVHRGLREKGE